MSKPREREIETALVQHLHHLEGWSVLGRQVQLPMGILDLLIMHRHDKSGCYAPIVVEIKRGRVNEAACGQLLGYVYQVSSIVRRHIWEKYGGGSPMHEAVPPLALGGWLVGRSISSRAKRLIGAGPLGYVPYEVGDHGLIKFDIGQAQFRGHSVWTAAKQDYEIPSCLEAVASAVEFNTRGDVSSGEQAHIDFGGDHLFSKTGTNDRPVKKGAGESFSLSETEEVWERYRDLTGGNDGD